LTELIGTTSTPTTPTILHGAHWNDDINDDDDDTNNSANMIEENTIETFDPDLKYFIITILKEKKDDIRQALNNGGIFSWEDFTLFNPDNKEYLTYKDGNENRELPFLTQKKIKYVIFYYEWLKQDNDPKGDFPRLWTLDKFIEWWHGPATRYIAANTCTDSFNSNSTQTNPAMKFQQSKDNNNLSNWKT
jgi:hypothetical protein